MAHARIIINVSNQDQPHSNGLAGSYIVPGKKEAQEFGVLVVYDHSEIQDLGENRRTQNWEWGKADELAKAIVGSGSFSGSKEKWGLLLCEAEPDLPRELEKAISDEITYLNRHVPQSKTVKDYDSGAAVLVTVEPESVSAEKERLSHRVRDLRTAFEHACRKLVQKKEVAKAQHALQIEDQRLIAEADKIWAGPEAGRQNINEQYLNACLRMGQTRPWCYQPEQLVDCPGCGAKIKENILICPQCQGRLFDGIEELREMKPKERAAAMYPELADPEPVTSGKK